MLFCINCGQQLPEEAKFCSKCGTAINSANKHNQRITVYDGIIHKCPNCGETLNSFSPNCTACGYELRGTKSSNVIQEFATKLMQTETKQQKIAMICNFPVPNTKEDILEFMILASSNINDDIENEFINAWLSKIEQTYKKAIFLFHGNEEFTKIQTIYNQTNKKIKKNKIIYSIKNTSGFLNKTVTLFSKIIPFVVKNIFVFLGIISYLKAIKLDITGENGVGFELLGGLLLITSAVLLIIRNSSYIEIILGIASGLLTFKLAEKLENGAGLQLLGTITLLLVFISFITKNIKSKKEKE